MTVTSVGDLFDGRTLFQNRSDLSLMKITIFTRLSWKMAKFCVFLVFISFTVFGITNARNIDTSDAVIPDEKWGYINLRPNAYMFWWLYGASSPEIKPVDRDKVPFVIWIQGGPGASGVGYGNFREIGPLDVNLKPRNTTWSSKANVLFIDNPVGTGYSYVTDNSAYTTNVEEIASDLLTFMKKFLDIMPVFRTMPTFIFGESFGGKMTSAFSVTLYKAIRDGKIDCRLDGVSIGDAVVSPGDQVMAWASYLYNFNLLDTNGLHEVQSAAEKCHAATEAGDYVNGMKSLDKVESVGAKLTDNVDVYNVLKHNTQEAFQTTTQWQTNLNSNVFPNNLVRSRVGRFYDNTLANLMNGPIRRKLKIIPQNVTWGAHSDMVYAKLYNTFTAPVIAYIDKLLSFNIQFVLYVGQLDLLASAPGNDIWMEKLTWAGMKKFKEATRKPLYVPGDKTKNTAAFFKEYQHFKMYYIMRAGHMVPKDNGPMALEMMSQIINPKK